MILILFLFFWLFFLLFFVWMFLSVELEVALTKEQDICFEGNVIEYAKLCFFLGRINTTFLKYERVCPRQKYSVSV